MPDEWDAAKEGWSRWCDSPVKGTLDCHVLRDVDPGLVS